MKKVIVSVKTLLVAITGIVGGAIWYFTSGREIEPIILIVISSLEIVGFIILRLIKGTGARDSNANNNYRQQIKNSGRIKNQTNIQKNKGDIEMR